MQRVIVTADIEVHTRIDVSTFEIRRQFDIADCLYKITNWIDEETDRISDFVCESLDTGEVKNNNRVGVYAIKKNIVLKPIEE